MPIYEFACTTCGTRFERLQAASDPGPACPSCGGIEVSRLISLIGGLTGGSGSGNGGSHGCACGGACSCRG